MEKVNYSSLKFDKSIVTVRYCRTVYYVILYTEKQCEVYNHLNFFEDILNATQKNIAYINN